MKCLALKPAAIVGFFLLVRPLLSTGQEFIDVEAEREALRRLPVTDTDVELVSTTGDTTAPAESDYGNSYTVPGIKPYSGQTVSATAALSDAANPTNASASNVGSLVLQVQQLQAEMRRLNGMIEEQAQQIARLQEQSLERYVDLDRRLAGATSTGNATTSPGGVSLARPAAIDSMTDESETPAQPGEEAAYQRAYDLVKIRQFASAVDAFRDFLDAYPFGRFAPNAHYWRGELYLVIATPDPELARQSFKLLLDQYPNNPKIPDALYKLGRVHFLKGNRDRSLEYLRRVIAEYPGHPAAQLAQDFVNEYF